MTATKIRPVQATAPERIYLQGGPQLPPETEFGALSEVTWCRDDVDGAGIPYVRADLAGAAPAAVAPRTRDLLGIVRTAQAEARRLINGEDSGSDLAQTKLDLPETLRVLEHALSQPAAVAPALDVTLDEDQAGLLRDMLGDPAEYEEALTVRLIVCDGHSGHGLYVAQAEYQDEGAALLAPLPATAAPALEAPAAPTSAASNGWRLVPTGRATTAMVLAASHAHVLPGASYSDLWTAMLAAAPQAPAGLDELRKISEIAACWGCDHPDAPGDTELLRRVKWAARQLRAASQAPAAPYASLEAVQWRNIHKVVKALADFSFGGPNDPQWGVAHICMTQGLTAKDGLDILSLDLEPLASAQAAPAAPAVDAALNALISDVRALPTLRASEIDGEESDGTPKHWRNRPFVSLRKLELLLRDRVTASSDTALLNFIAAEYLDLRSFGMPTGQSDADVGWRVIQHHMGEPTERVVAEVYKDDPRSAIRAAIARLERDPYCTGALHEEDAAQAEEGGAA